MIFYKKLKADGTLDMIGTQEVLPDNAIEITETEYTELYKYIQENAVHIEAENDNTEGVI